METCGSLRMDVDVTRRFALDPPSDNYAYSVYIHRKIEFHLINARIINSEYHLPSTYENLSDRNQCFSKD